MGRKRYNWKARSIAEVEIDNSQAKKIVVDIQHRAEDYDNCNALILPSKKRDTENKIKRISTTRLLSKKRRKELEKIVERKRKKLRRAELLEGLSTVQAPQEELGQYVSLTTVQTKGLKRHFRESQAPVPKLTGRRSKASDEDQSVESPLNAVKGSKKLRLAILEAKGQEGIESDPNILAFEDSNDSESSSENEENHTEETVGNSDAHLVHVESNSLNDDKPVEGIDKVKQPEIDSVKEEKREKTHQKGDLHVQERKPATFVPLNRDPEIQAARLKLPVLAEEQIIMETINENAVVIITGETGSGKTTQVPQFLFEAGYAKEKLIGVTEPRRVAAMSMSKRVAEEMNLTEKEVSYLIRFEGNVGPETKIKFMTDGVLLKEIQSDFLLKNYSVIILDEAHERSVYTDILIGLLSRIVPLRHKRGDPLKLVIMSATLRVEEFVENSKLFKVKPPVVSIESRQYPVTIHFNRHTRSDYVGEAFRKTVKIHTQLPEGGILIFLTGQREVKSLVRKLRKAFPLKHGSDKLGTSASEEKFKGNNHMSATDDRVEVQDSGVEGSDDDFPSAKAIVRNKRRNEGQALLPNVNLDDYSVLPVDDSHVDLIGEAEDEEQDEDEDEDEDEDDDATDLSACLRGAQPLWVLPLYSLLPSYEQARVFERPPDGCRLCVVSTNVAETSLTIPNVKYVVDSGRCKTRMYDKITGVSTYRVCYASKASANQRAGRAGRTSAGHCYRLYSSAVFNDQFELFGQSEIQRKPIDDLLLQMKVMNIDKVVNFPFPTPPDVLQLQTAERRLIILGALQQLPTDKKESYSARVTPLGHSIAAFPVAPRYGKMLALSHQHSLLEYTVCMVAALSVQELLVEPIGAEKPTKFKWSQTRRFWAGRANSFLLGDPMILIRAIGAAEHANIKGTLETFCEEHNLRYKAVVEVRKLRRQLTNEINLTLENLNLAISPQMEPPTDAQAKLLRQIVLAGMVDRIAKKVTPDDVPEDQDKSKWKYAYRTLEMEDPVFVHSSCVLRKHCPEWVVYQELYETNKVYMRGVTAIEAEWLPKFAPALCQLGEPLAEHPPRYDTETGNVTCTVTGTFGKAGWRLPTMEVEYPVSTEGVKWFAHFFLDGQVFPKLKRFVPVLLSTPASAVKPWAKLIPRTLELTNTLLSRGVMSKSKLLEVWHTDEKFLLAAYQKWLPESAHADVARLWPPF